MSEIADDLHKHYLETGRKICRIAAAELRRLEDVNSNLRAELRKSNLKNTVLQSHIRLAVHTLTSKTTEISVRALIDELKKEIEE